MRVFFVWFILSLFLSAKSFAQTRTPVVFGEDNAVSVLSDKAFRYADKNIFEAIGNVIITRGNDTLYGESATLNLSTKEIVVEGSVRFTTNEVTMYGSRINYNIGDVFLKLENARVVSKSFSLFGKEISRVGDNKIIAKKAEYSSCRDCPQSWSIYGGVVEITIGDYVRITDALFKVNGVPTVFIPYLIFPIKRGRETGLLFPELYTSSAIEGVIFKQPFYWAIDDSKDLTFAPSIFGDRGFGSDFEYRQVLGEGKWFELNGIHLFDKIYNPNYIRGDNRETEGSRYFGSYEHKFQFGLWGNHHLTLSDARDLDMVRDFETEVSEDYLGNDLGVSSFFEFKSDRFHVGLEGHFRENLIIGDPSEFDHGYIQVLPKVSLGMTDINIFQSEIPGLRKLDFGFNSDLTVFKQNHDLEEDTEFIRNAERLNLESYLSLNMGHIGPVRFQSQIYGDLQRYNFPRVTDDKTNFEKWAYFAKNEITVEIDRIFGLAYTEKVLNSKVENEIGKSNLNTSGDPNLKKKSKNLTIGSLPEFEKDLADDYVTIIKNSYRHAQEFKLINYKIINSGINGNAVFGGQINNSAGLFDYLDANRETEAETAFLESRKELNRKDMLELQWNNTVIKKSVRSAQIQKDGKYLKDNFNYDKLFSFNISQGFDVSANSTRQDGFKEKLARGAILTSLNLGSFTLTGNEYYFYNGKHIFDFSTNYNSYFFDYSIGFGYNSIDENIPTNTARSSVTFRPVEFISLFAQYDFDLRSRNNNKELYELSYIPLNNCWEIKFAFSDDAIQSQYLVDFKLRFNSDFSTLF